MPLFVKCSSVPTALRHAQSYDRDQNCDQLILLLEKKRVFAVSKNFRARGKAANCAVECMVCLQAIDGRVQPLDGAYDFQDEDDWERFPLVEAGRQAGQLSLKRGEKMPPRDCSLCCAFYFSEQF